jgi:hypothetical protein
LPCFVIRREPVVSNVTVKIAIADSGSFKLRSDCLAAVVPDEMADSLIDKPAPFARPGNS